MCAKWQRRENIALPLGTRLLCKDRLFPRKNRVQVRLSYSNKPAIAMFCKVDTSTYLLKNSGFCAILITGFRGG